MAHHGKRWRGSETTNWREEKKTDDGLLEIFVTVY